jgi:hypothetical protein
VKREGKVFDEYFEAYVDAHDEGERVEGPTDAVGRIAAFWAVNVGRLVYPLHRIGATLLRTGRTMQLSTVRYKARLRIAEQLNCSALL